MKGIRQFLFTTILLLILFSFAMFQGGFVSWFLFFSYLSIYTYQLLFMLYTVKKWELSRHIDPQVIHAGDDLKVWVTIKRRVPFPLPYVVLEEIMPESLHHVYPFQLSKAQISDHDQLYKKMIFPWFKRQMTIPFELPQVPRGEHHLSQMRVRTSDLFGFITKEYVFKLDSILKVYPRRREVRMAKQLSGFEQGAMSDSALHYKSAHVASGIREYAPGDKLSWINWKQTARKNKLMTKEFEREKSTDTLVIFDRHVVHDGRRFAFEGAVEVVSGLTETLYKKPTNMGFLSIGEDLFQVPLYDHPNKMKHIYDHCMKVQPVRGETFTGHLKQQLTQNRHECVLVIVTTRIDASLKQAVIWAKQRAQKVMLILVQDSQHIGTREKELIQAMTYEQVLVSVLTENVLKEQAIEVNV